MHYKLYGWLIIALACGVSCSFAVKAMLQGENGKAVLDTNGSMTQIMVAKIDLTPGIELGPQNIRFDLVPEEKVPQNAIFRYDGIAGRKVIGHIACNKPISQFDLEMKIETTNRESSFIPPGFSVVPIRIENVTSGGTLSDLASVLKLEDIISAGDRVSLNVLLEERVGKQGDSVEQVSQRIVSKPLVENVSIYSVKTELLPYNGDHLKKTPIVSVLLDREKTDQVKVAMREGKLRMTLTQGKTDIESLDPSQSGNAAPIAVNILSNLGRFRSDDPNAVPNAAVADSAKTILPKQTPSAKADSLDSLQKPVPATQAEKTASSGPTSAFATKKAVTVTPTSAEKQPESKISDGTPATASSNATFLLNSPLKKVTKESGIVDTQKKSEVTPTVPKAPQEKERTQESSNGFRSRATGYSASLPAHNVQVMRPVTPAPQQIPAVTVPRRSSLTIAEENGFGSNF